MEFQEAISIINECLPQTVDKAYDGICVKKLESSNTLDEGRTTKQTHIAITGPQMDMFPYFIAPGYFNCEYADRDDSLRNQFIAQVPFRIHKSNVEQLTGSTDDLFEYNAENYYRAYVSIVRNRRSEANDQLQLSSPTFDDNEMFVNFRRLLHVGDYLVMLKIRGMLEYDCFGIRSDDAQNGSIPLLNNNYYKLKGKTKDVTKVKIDDFITIKDELKYETSLDVSKFGYDSLQKRNRIVFGAPGTGKSQKISKDVELLREKCGVEYERVTFYPDYSYAGFVGTYKPVMVKVKDDANAREDNDREDIKYEFVPGPFMRLYGKALANAQTPNPKPHVLIIEEINRANAAAVFGDIFQLLDRNDKNVSEYAIQASYDIRQYLSEVDGLGGDKDLYSQIKIPDNMFIWATMNSADQGVFPMDTAFKRRWSFEYLGVDKGEKDSNGFNVPGVFELNGHPIEWNAFRKALNDLLSSENVRVHEDKLLGPFFINTKNYLVGDDTENLKDGFVDVINYKVLMYLFEDAAKTKRSSVFVGNANTNRFSVLCDEFKNKGLEIFAKVGKEDFSTVYDKYVRKVNKDCRIHKIDSEEESDEDAVEGEVVTGANDA